jgi:hypothetical protein
MDDVQQIIILLQILIGIGAAGRITFCCIQKAMNADGQEGYNKRIKNAAIFAVVAELITTIISLAKSYF